MPVVPQFPKWWPSYAPPKLAFCFLSQFSVVFLKVLALSTTFFERFFSMVSCFGFIVDYGLCLLEPIMIFLRFSFPPSLLFFNWLTAGWGLCLLWWGFITGLVIPFLFHEQENVHLQSGRGWRDRWLSVQSHCSSSRGSKLSSWHPRLVVSTACNSSPRGNPYTPGL